MKKSELIEKYQSYKYKGFYDIDDINIKEMVCLYKSKSCILLYKKSEEKIHVIWVAETEDDLLKAISLLIGQIKNKSIYLEFVPESFIVGMKNIGFEIYSEYSDFWNNDIKSINKEDIKINIRELENTEYDDASEITHLCKGQSRGFDGESKKVIKEWFEKENSTIFVALRNKKIVGLVLVSLYGFNSEKGIALWIRLLAVNPEFQRKGIGRALLSYAINWGIDNNAKRSFLHADVHNDGAINMYKRMGYVKNEGRGQINMQLSR